eukprot:g13653.t1
MSCSTAERSSPSVVPPKPAPSKRARPPGAVVRKQGPKETRRSWGNFFAGLARGGAGKAMTAANKGLSYAASASNGAAYAIWRNALAVCLRRDWTSLLRHAPSVFAKAVDVGGAFPAVWALSRLALKVARCVLEFIPPLCPVCYWGSRKPITAGESVWLQDPQTENWVTGMIVERVIDAAKIEEDVVVHHGVTSPDQRAGNRAWRVLRNPFANQGTPANICGKTSEPTKHPPRKRRLVKLRGRPEPVDYRRILQGNEEPRLFCDDVMHTNAPLTPLENDSSREFRRRATGEARPEPVFGLVSQILIDLAYVVGQYRKNFDDGVRALFRGKDPRPHLPANVELTFPPVPREQEQASQSQSDDVSGGEEQQEHENHVVARRRRVSAGIVHDVPSQHEIQALLDEYLRRPEADKNKHQNGGKDLRPSSSTTRSDRTFCTGLFGDHTVCGRRDRFVEFFPQEKTKDIDMEGMLKVFGVDYDLSYEHYTWQQDQRTCEKTRTAGRAFPVEHTTARGGNLQLQPSGKTGYGLGGTYDHATMEFRAAHVPAWVLGQLKHLILRCPGVRQGIAGGKMSYAQLRRMYLGGKFAVVKGGEHAAGAASAVVGNCVQGVSANYDLVLDRIAIEKVHSTGGVAELGLSQTDRGDYVVDGHLKDGKASIKNLILHDVWHKVPGYLCLGHVDAEKIQIPHFHFALGFRAMRTIEEEGWRRKMLSAGRRRAKSISPASQHEPKPASTDTATEAQAPLQPGSGSILNFFASLAKHRRMKMENVREKHFVFPSHALKAGFNALGSYRVLLAGKDPPLGANQGGRPRVRSGSHGRAGAARKEEAKDKERRRVSYQQKYAVDAQPLLNPSWAWTMIGKPLFTSLPENVPPAEIADGGQAVDIQNVRCEYFKINPSHTMVGGLTRLAQTLGGTWSKELEEAVKPYVGRLVHDIVLDSNAKAMMVPILDLIMQPLLVNLGSVMAHMVTERGKVSPGFKQLRARARLDQCRARRRHHLSPGGSSSWSSASEAEQVIESDTLLMDNDGNVLQSPEDLLGPGGSTSAPGRGREDSEPDERDFCAEIEMFTPYYGLLNMSPLLTGSLDGALVDDPDVEDDLETEMDAGKLLRVWHPGSPGINMAAGDQEQSGAGAALPAEPFRVLTESLQQMAAKYGVRLVAKDGVSQVEAARIEKIEWTPTGGTVAGVIEIDDAVLEFPDCAGAWPGAVGGSGAFARNDDDADDVDGGGAVPASSCSRYLKRVWGIRMKSTASASMRYLTSRYFPFDLVQNPKLRDDLETNNFRGGVEDDRFPLVRVRRDDENQDQPSDSGAEDHHPPREDDDFELDDGSESSGGAGSSDVEEVVDDVEELFASRDDLDQKMTGEGLAGGEEGSNGSASRSWQTQQTPTDKKFVDFEQQMDGAEATLEVGSNAWGIENVFVSVAGAREGHISSVTGSSVFLFEKRTGYYEGWNFAPLTNFELSAFLYLHVMLFSFVIYLVFKVIAERCNHTGLSCRTQLRRKCCGSRGCCRRIDLHASQSPNGGRVQAGLSSSVSAIACSPGLVHRSQSADGRLCAQKRPPMDQQLLAGRSKCARRKCRGGSPGDDDDGGHSSPGDSERESVIRQRGKGRGRESGGDESFITSPGDESLDSQSHERSLSDEDRSKAKPKGKPLGVTPGKQRLRRSYSDTTSLISLSPEARKRQSETSLAKEAQIQKEINRQRRYTQFRKLIWFILFPVFLSTVPLFLLSRKVNQPTFFAGKDSNYAYAMNLLTMNSAPDAAAEIDDDITGGHHAKRKTSRQRLWKNRRGRTKATMAKAAAAAEDQHGDPWMTDLRDGRADGGSKCDAFLLKLKRLSQTQLRRAAHLLSADDFDDPDEKELYHYCVSSRVTLTKLSVNVNGLKIPMDGFSWVFQSLMPSHVWMEGRLSLLVVEHASFDEEMAGDLGRGEDEDSFFLRPHDFDTPGAEQSDEEFEDLEEDNDSGGDYEDVHGGGTTAEAAVAVAGTPAHRSGAHVEKSPFLVAPDIDATDSVQNLLLKERTSMIFEDVDSHLFEKVQQEEEAEEVLEASWATSLSAGGVDEVGGAFMAADSPGGARSVLRVNDSDRGSLPSAAAATPPVSPSGASPPPTKTASGTASSSPEEQDESSSATSSSPSTSTSSPSSRMPHRRIITILVCSGGGSLYARIFGSLWPSYACNYPNTNEGPGFSMGGNLFVRFMSSVMLQTDLINSIIGRSISRSQQRFLRESLSKARILYSQKRKATVLKVRMDVRVHDRAHVFYGAPGHHLHGSGIDPVTGKPYNDCILPDDLKRRPYCRFKQKLLRRNRPRVRAAVPGGGLHPKNVRMKRDLEVHIGFPSDDDAEDSVRHVLVVDGSSSGRHGRGMLSTGSIALPRSRHTGTPDHPIDLLGSWNNYMERAMIKFFFKPYVVNMYATSFCQMRILNYKDARPVRITEPVRVHLASDLSSVGVTWDNVLEVPLNFPNFFNPTMKASCVLEKDEVSAVHGWEDVNDGGRRESSHGLNTGEPVAGSGGRAANGAESAADGDVFENLQRSLRGENTRTSPPAPSAERDDIAFATSSVPEPVPVDDGLLETDGRHFGQAQSLRTPEDDILYSKQENQHSRYYKRIPETFAPRFNFLKKLATDQNMRINFDIQPPRGRGGIGLGFGDFGPEFQTSVRRANRNYDYDIYRASITVNFLPGIVRWYVGERVVTRTDILSTGEDDTMVHKRTKGVITRLEIVSGSSSTSVMSPFYYNDGMLYNTNLIMEILFSTGVIRELRTRTKFGERIILENYLKHDTEFDECVSRSLNKDRDLRNKVLTVLYKVFKPERLRTQHAHVSLYQAANTVEIQFLVKAAVGAKALRDPLFDAARMQGGVADAKYPFRIPFGEVKDVLRNDLSLHVLNLERLSDVYGQCVERESRAVSLRLHMSKYTALHKHDLPLVVPVFGSVSPPAYLGEELLAAAPDPRFRRGWSMDGEFARVSGNISSPPPPFSLRGPPPGMMPAASAPFAGFPPGNDLALHQQRQDKALSQLMRPLQFEVHAVSNAGAIEPIKVDLRLGLKEILHSFLNENENASDVADYAHHEKIPCVLLRVRSPDNVLRQKMARDLKLESHTAIKQLHQFFVRDSLLDSGGRKVDSHEDELNIEEVGRALFEEVEDGPELRINAGAGVATKEDAASRVKKDVLKNLPLHCTLDCGQILLTKDNMDEKYVGTNLRLTRYEVKILHEKEKPDEAESEEVAAKRKLLYVDLRFSVRPSAATDPYVRSPEGASPDPNAAGTATAAATKKTKMNQHEFIDLRVPRSATRFLLRLFDEAEREHARSDAVMRRAAAFSGVSSSPTTGTTGSRRRREDPDADGDATAPPEPGAAIEEHDVRSSPAALYASTAKTRKVVLQWIYLEEPRSASLPPVFPWRVFRAGRPPHMCEAKFRQCEAHPNCFGVGQVRRKRRLSAEQRHTTSGACYLLFLPTLFGTARIRALPQQRAIA